MTGLRQPNGSAATDTNVSKAAWNSSVGAPAIGQERVLWTVRFSFLNRRLPSAAGHQGFLANGREVIYSEMQVGWSNNF